MGTAAHPSCRPAAEPRGSRHTPFVSRLGSGSAALLLAACLAAASCGKGSSGPSEDNTPPAAPRLDKLNVGIPQDGQVTVSGADSCVEARARVVVENLTASEREGSEVSAETNASVAGAFVIRLPATIGDQLSVFAVDDAENEGPSVELAAGPNVSTFRLSLVSGTGQTGVVDRPLTEPFRVRVRGGVPAADLPGVLVRFEVLSGGGTISSAATTDESGVAQATLTLGGAQGGAEARASVDGVAGDVRFSATAVGPPQVVSANPTEADRGATVEIMGRNFSPIAAHDVVEFNGVQAEVQSAAADRLITTVPSFASDGPLTVTLTGVRSNELAFKVKGPPPTLPAVGSVSRTPLTFSGGQLTTDLRLGFLDGSEGYVVAVEALSTDASTLFRLGIAADVAALAEGSVPSAGRKGAAHRAGRLAAVAGQARAEAAFRAWEVEIARAAAGKPRPAPARLAGGEPQIGDHETFHVINTVDPAASIVDPKNFDEVQTVLRFKGAHTLVYVDERVPALDLTDADVREVGDRFDKQSYAVDTDTFGRESDLDGDGRVTIVLTATVNALNQGASPDEGIVIGFFFALDLLPSISPSTSNKREMFYGFVPDPSGQFGPPIPRDFAIPTLDEVFAHEFQHMISFNQHVLVRGGQPEQLWLNEGLSHLAEDLNGFDDGNEARSALYLVDPTAAGLALNFDTLEARGAAFLFLRWLGDQLGEGIFAQLEQTNLVGIGNVQAATGQGLPNLFSDWFAALYLDDSGLGAADFQIPSLTLRFTYERFRTENPELGLGPFLGVQHLAVPKGTTTEGLTVGTAGSFYEVDTDAGTNERKLTISAPATSQAQVTVIRTR